MATNEPSNMAMPLDEQLVAYLDGELDADGSRRIEELLATDPEARRRLQVMERTWEMLDDLDEAPLGGKFTQTTLEMVAVAARKDVDESLALAPRRRRRRLWIVGGSLFGALLAGFLTVVLHTTVANRQLLRDMPVLQNFDVYRQIESIEFLRMLDKENLFPAESDEAGHETALKPEIPLTQRREHIEKMSPADKEDLVQGEERFAGLDKEHQQRLRALHAAIETDPSAEHLRHVMLHYCDWAKGLSYSSRAELAEMAPTDRIGWIKKWFKEEPARGNVGRLTAKDVDAVWKWMIDCATRRQAQILEKLPAMGRERLAKSSPDVRYRELIREIWPPRQGAAAGKPQLLSDDDLTQLAQTVSPEARQQLERLKPPEQWRMVSVWARQTLRAKRGPLPKDDDERLADFFEQLPTEQRNRLLDMPGDEMRWALLQLYYRQTRQPEGAGARPEGQKGRRAPGQGFSPQGGKRTTPDKNDKESPGSNAP